MRIFDFWLISVNLDTAGITCVVNALNFGGYFDDEIGKLIDFAAFNWAFFEQITAISQNLRRKIRASFCESLTADLASALGPVL